MEILIVAVVVIGLAVAARVWSNALTKKRLMERYGDVEIVRMIMAKKIWQGMTEEQLIDSWGRPAAIDERVFKSKISRTFKYAQAGKNRFRERVKIENGIIVGWDQK